MHLILLYGPVAVGKATVGKELSRLTGYPLFHNHKAIEPLLGIFRYDSTEFHDLSMQFRHMVIGKAIEARFPGLITTLVWDLDSADDLATVDSLTQPVLAAEGRVSFVELSAPQVVRLDREGSEDRIAMKPSKANVEEARWILRDLDNRARLNSEWEEEPRPGVIKLSTDGQSAADNAAIIVKRLGLSIGK